MTFKALDVAIKIGLYLPRLGGALRIVSEDSLLNKVFPADCPQQQIFTFKVLLHPIPFSGRSFQHIVRF